MRWAVLAVGGRRCGDKSDTAPATCTRRLLCACHGRPWQAAAAIAKKLIGVARAVAPVGLEARLKSVPRVNGRAHGERFVPHLARLQAGTPPVVVTGIGITSITSAGPTVVGREVVHGRPARQ